MFISLIICTYRRPDRLKRALISLEGQSYEGFDWEVLVVENDRVSSSAMLAVIAHFKDILPLQHILEPNVGLSIARNTGARLAGGEYLAYMDDDAEAEVDWLATLMDICRSSKPDFCGGPSLPLYLSPKPAWFLDKYATSYVYGEEARLLKEGEWLGGMNFIVSKNLCNDLGGFRADLGMTGNQVAYGEETDLMIRAWDSNPLLKVLYHPKVVVRHEVRPEKMTLRWHIKAALAGGRSSAIISPITRRRAVYELMRNAKGIVIVLLDFGKSWFNNQEEKLLWQQWIFEVFYSWVWNVSRNYNSLIRK